MPETTASPSPSATDHPLLEMRGISKSFFGVSALSGVDFNVRRGEVHALIGENGAGKSTLMKILAGAMQPDSGHILLDGQPVRFGSPHQAQRRGISIIYQEFNLLPVRSVAQNIFLGREPRRGLFVDAAQMERDTAALLEQLGVRASFTPASIVGRLSVAQQQTVEIARALSFDSRLVVMDEPTASLAPAEVATLFQRVRELQARGLAFVFISHRLEELLHLAQRVTVLKDGQLVATVETAGTTPRQLISMMVGRELDSYYPPLARPEEIGGPALEIRDAGNERLHAITLTARRGEIVGIAGLEGSGRTELARAIFGADPFTAGVVTLHGEPARFTDPRQAIKAGIGFLTEDRKSEGLVLIQDIRNNALLAARSVRAVKGRDGAGSGDVAADARRVDLRAASLAQEARYLSGGNQQKVVLMKWLQTRAGLLIFDEPTRGIDVGAKAGIHDLMRHLARAGASILMVSSELPEVIGMSDRILVMRNGTIAGELPAGATEGRIMTIASGQEGAA